MKINDFVRRYFALILLLSAGIGLIIPTADINLTGIILVSLASIIFSSFFQIELNSKLFTEDMQNMLLFSGLRFIVFPVVIYYLFAHFSVLYAAVFLLFLLLPAAVSSPAFTTMFSGKISLSLKVLVFTSFLSIITIPLICQFVLSKKVSINTRQMFLTMVYTIVVPFIIHLPFRKSGTVRSVLIKNNPLITSIGLSIIFIAAISHNRSVILGSPLKMIIYAVISCCAYLLLYFLAYSFSTTQDKTQRISFSVSSGANNIGLGVTITALFFPGEINLFFIIAQVTWIFALIPVKYFYRIKKSPLSR